MILSAVEIGYFRYNNPTCAADVFIDTFIHISGNSVIMPLLSYIIQVSGKQTNDSVNHINANIGSMTTITITW